MTLSHVGMQVQGGGRPMLIHTGDTVEVITGADRGTRSRVIQVDRVKGKVLVENVNRVYKHVRRSQKHPQGGRLSKEMPVNISNVMAICQSCDAKSRLGVRYLKDGAKERFCKKCGSSAGEISPAHAAYAKVGK
ncbi:MAG: 50S ribosomal protein L24 [Pirellulales bacterium]